MAEVKFCVHVEVHGPFYGVTLFADDGTESDEVACFRSCFSGEPGRDRDEVVELFAQAHQEAMDQVGLSGVVTPDVYEERMMESVSAAGRAMSAFGLTAVAFDQVPDDVLYALFADALPGGENAPGSEGVLN